MKVSLMSNVSHFRRRPLQKLQHPNPESLFQNEGSNNTLAYSLKKDKQFSNSKNGIFPPAYNDNEHHDSESLKPPLILHTSDSKKHGSKRPKSVDTPRKRQKKKALLRELFGEDDTEDVSVNFPRTQKLGQEPSSNREVNNYLSTTVNVNYYKIYNAIPNSSLASNSSDLKRTSYTEKSLQKSTNVPQKKLRIDVSLSGENVSGIKKDQLVSAIESKEDSYSAGTPGNRKKSAQKHSKRKSSSKKKPKKDRQKSSKLSPTTNTIITEEDPSIKELWSILGMESPTDRTAKFLSNQLNLSSSETITLHGAADPIATLQETPTLADKTQCGSTPEIVEPFLKVSEPFSLATINAQECNDIGIESRGDIGSNEDGVKKYSCSISENVIETINLEEDVDESDEILRNPNNISKQLNQEDGQKSFLEESSKVGTIRVKSMGLLVDPQLQPTNNENVFTTDKVALSSTEVSTGNAELSNEDNSCENTTETSVDERFFATYAYYFDELVETKIPKLGELLHLAIADAMRLTERAKRADQLSSEDLIKEEKLRAGKDFIEMMKIRGVEFSPLCDIIVKRFDKGSKITLFLALFWRILKHAGTIDPANEGYIVEARKVISLMLKRHQYKDKDILDKLLNDEDFEEQVKKVRVLVEKYVRRNDNTAVSTITCNNSRNNATCSTPTTNQVTQSRGSKNVAFRITGDSYKRLQEMLYNTGRSGNLNQGQDKTFSSLNENLNGKEKSTLQNTTATSKTAVNDTENVIPCRTQQPLLPQQTKISPNKTIHQGTSKNYNCNPPTDLINRFQKQNVSLVNTVNNPNTFTNENASPKPRLQPAVTQNPIIRPGQNQNNILKSQLSLPARSNETPNRRNLSPGQKIQCQTFVPPQAPSRTIGIPTRAAPTSSPVFRAPPTPTIVGKQPQAATSASPLNRNPSVTNCYHNVSVLTSASVVGTTNTTNTTAPPQYVRSSVQQSFNTTSAPPYPRLSSSGLPGRGDIVVGHQQRINVLNRPELQQPRFDQVNTAASNFDRNVVDPANPTVVGINSSQLCVTTLNDGSITNTRSESIGADGSAIPTITPTSLTAGSSPRAPSSPEITSPTAEVRYD